MTEEELNRVGDWLGVEWSASQRDQMNRYEKWLLDEALPAGGIGPREAPRLFDRHIADSLAFLRLIGPDVESLVDIGSGVGLPAIPIAIARRDIAVTILDRSERRTRLAGRALRILGLRNAETATTDAANVGDTFDIVTFRASLTIDQAEATFDRLAKESGIGLYAWSRQANPKSPPGAQLDTIFNLVSEGSSVLESPAWILRMQRNQQIEE